MVTIEDFAFDVTSTEDGAVSIDSIELCEVCITRVLAELPGLFSVSSAADTLNIDDCNVDESETKVDGVL